MKDQFLNYWEKEAATTRKVLSRIPEGSDYRPDPKSRPAREIAWLIVRESIVLVEGLEKGSLEWAEVPAPATMKEVLDAWDRGDMVKRMKSVDSARWDGRVPFMMGGQQVMNEPAIDNAFGFLFDIVHHRGQITTYLRAMGSTVPQIYGPSADEPM
jgi:DinB family protein